MKNIFIIFPLAISFSTLASEYPPIVPMPALPPGYEHLAPTYYGVGAQVQGTPREANPYYNPPQPDLYEVDIDARRERNKVCMAVPIANSREVEIACY